MCTASSVCGVYSVYIQKTIKVLARIWQLYTITVDGVGTKVSTKGQVKPAPLPVIAHQCCSMHPQGIG